MNDLKDLVDIFESIRQSCGFDDYYNYSIGATHDGFESHFSRSGGGRQELSNMDVMTLKSRYETNRGTTHFVSKNRDSQKRDERPSYALEGNDER